MLLMTFNFCVADPKFIANASLWHRVFFLYMSLLVARTKYYGVWLFGKRSCEGRCVNMINACYVCELNTVLKCI